MRHLANLMYVIHTIALGVAIAIGSVAVAQETPPGGETNTEITIDQGSDTFVSEIICGRAKRRSRHRYR